MLIIKNFFAICLSALLLCSQVIAAGKPNVQLTILNLNDFHGQLEEAYNDPKNPAKGFQYPGAARIASWVNQFKKTHPSILFLAGGDNYQGTMLSNYYDGITYRSNSVSDFFNALGISYSALGNHEFDFDYAPHDPSSFIYSAQMHGMHFIASNVTTDDMRPIHFAEPYQIIKKRVGSRELNIVIIGLATIDTPITTSGAKGLKFNDPGVSAVTAWEAAKKELSKKREKADVVLFLTHTPSIQSLDPDYVPKLQDPVVYIPQKSLGGKSEIQELTEKIAAVDDIKNISVVLSGHSHKLVNGYVPGNKIPVVQGGYSGRALSIVNITCPRNPNRSCSLSTDVVNLAAIAGDYKPDPTVTKIVDKYLYDPSFQQMANREITSSCTPISMQRVDNFNFKLHYLIANQMRHSQKTDIGVYNFGGLRADLPAGNVIFKDLYNSMPFDTYNLVETGTIPGWAIRQMVDDDLHLAHAQVAIAGIAFNGRPLSATEHYTGDIYLTKRSDHYDDPTDGSFNIAQPILVKDDGTYTITSVDFLLDNAGDGFKFEMVTNKNYPMDDVHQTRLTVRQMYENELVSMKKSPCQDYTPYNWQTAIVPPR